jgi:hypothetical protein
VTARRGIGRVFEINEASHDSDGILGISVVSSANVGRRTDAGCQRFGSAHRRGAQISDQL